MAAEIAQKKRLDVDATHDVRFGIDIVVVTTSWPSAEGDASGHFVRSDVRALERDGHRVRVVWPKNVDAFGWPGAAVRIRERPWRALGAAVWIATAAARARSWRCDRVIAHWAVPSAVPIAMNARRDLEIVSHGGDVRLLRAMPAPVREAIVSKLTTRASRWRFVSRTLLADLANALSSTNAQRLVRIAEVAPSAIDLPDAGELRKAASRLRADAGAGAPIAVSVGRLVPSKRVDRAIAHAAQKRMRLVVVGDGPERERLETRARALGVDARFLGKMARTDALAWIAAADVLVHASEAEGLSTVLREAEALGTAVEVL